MNKLEPIPENITADRTIQEVIVQWSDGHISNFPFQLLRAACPCAVCRGGHENMRPEPDPAVFDILLPESPATRMNSLQAVGSYGLTFEWKDGHHDGIFNWHYLRLLCPCDECRESPSNGD
jgi:DUF971 family protein